MPEYTLTYEARQDPTLTVTGIERGKTDTATLKYSFNLGAIFRAAEEDNEFVFAPDMDTNEIILTADVMRDLVEKLDELNKKKTMLGLLRK
jgi:hypothetical protein